MFLCVIMKHNYAIKAEMETTMEIQMWKEILTPYDLGGRTSDKIQPYN